MRSVKRTNKSSQYTKAVDANVAGREDNQLLSLVYKFLKHQGLKKAANLLLKENQQIASVSTTTSILELYNKFIIEQQAKRKQVEKTLQAESESSSSESDSASDEDHGNEVKPGYQNNQPNAPLHKNANDDSDSSSDSDEDGDKVVSSKQSKKQMVGNDTSDSSASSSSSEEEMDPSPIKTDTNPAKEHHAIYPNHGKREGESIHPSQAKKVKPLDNNNNKHQNNDRFNKNALPNDRFSRIKDEQVEFIDERLKDNSFLAKSGAIGSYGHKAHSDLIVTRGKNFRAEKNKKKRGSYRGGVIDTQSHSIKFHYDD